MASFLGPFGGYWIGLAMLFVHVDVTDTWDDWGVWVAVPIWIGWTFFNMIMVATMGKGILDWTDQPPQDNLPDKKLISTDMHIDF